MANSIVMALGVVLITLGLVGFVMPDLAGAHLGMAVNVVHLVSGIASVQLARYGSARGLGRLAVGLGALYLGLGSAGFALGQGADTLVAVAGGSIVLGSADHVV